MGSREGSVCVCVWRWGGWGVVNVWYVVGPTNSGEETIIYVLGMLYLCTCVGRAGQVSTHETEMGDSSYSSIGKPPLFLR